MNFLKEFVISLAVVLVVVVAVIAGTTFLDEPAPITDSRPQGIPGGTPDLGPASPDDPAFFNQQYKGTSGRTLHKKEKTVTYTYPSSPCGTLTTQFSQVGSVRVGRGPVYELASIECRAVNSDYVPNDFSFWVYSCENIQGPYGIQGQATFAFQCSPANEDTRCFEARVNGETGEPDWNCAGI